ncbi:MAG: UDP-N-acetylmuramoyl-L-alanine--D-glutamate ligase [Holosporaceae bacterium]|jgi:UDP-N-acetylmuramoylalanine--D-glutamate ligase|nr:UDP-N-acetylmuramoyl-L-alanine--D-glutamate ligase [Holosporaceae bacterium]
MIRLNFYKNKHVGIIGFGKTGKSVADALIESGACVSICDDCLICDAKYQILNPSDLDWKSIDFLVVSPGVNLLWPKPHLAVEFARKYSIPIINDIDLFQQQVVQKNICITGTNGKSTTAALVNHILNCANKRSLIGGNFGNTVLSLNEDVEFYVLEISSYQLESCSILGFDTAVLLNITPDHLVRHGGMIGYIAAKQRIFANFHENSCAIVGVDDDYCSEIFTFLKYIKYPHLIPISGQKVPELGVGWSDDKLIDDRFGSFDVVCDANPMFEGTHNRQNIAATYAACIVHKITKAEFRNGLFSFGGLEHRQELVANILGIQYVNDSKATNADSVEQALKRFDNILWILGGRPKENGITNLVKYFHKIRFAFLIGEVSEEWSQFFEKHNVKYEISHTLEIAVKRAHEISKNFGNVVLLSPACASFDQFKDFEERGNCFRNLVHNLGKSLSHD